MALGIHIPRDFVVFVRMHSSRLCRHIQGEVALKNIYPEDVFDILTTGPGMNDREIQICWNVAILLNTT